MNLSQQIAAKEAELAALRAEEDPAGFIASQDRRTALERDLVDLRELAKRGAERDAEITRTALERELAEIRARRAAPLEAVGQLTAVVRRVLPELLTLLDAAAGEVHARNLLHDRERQILRSFGEDPPFAPADVSLTEPRCAVGELLVGKFARAQQVRQLFDGLSPMRASVVAASIVEEAAT